MSESQANYATGQLTLRELLRAFLDHEQSRNLSHCTLRNHRCILTVFLDWLEAREQVVTADRLRQAHLDAWLKHLNGRRTREGLPLKAPSINLLITAVRSFLDYLAVRGMVSAALKTGLPCVKTPNLLPQGALTHAQVRRLLDRIPTGKPEGYRDRAMIEVLYSSGLRAAELLGLNVDDVDFDNATAMVTGKGNKQRVVPIGRTALRYLESYLKAVRPFLLRDPGERAVFLDQKGHRVRYNAFARAVRVCATRAGLEKIHVTAHTFRRSCATELLRGGANMYHVKDLLGHSTLNTLKHYARLTITDLKKTHAKCHPKEKDACERGLLDGGEGNE